MEQKQYILWHVTDVFQREIGKYNSYEDAFDAAKELDDKYNDASNVWEEKDRFYIAEDDLRPSKLKKLLRSDRYLHFNVRNRYQCGWQKKANL